MASLADVARRQAAMERAQTRMSGLEARLATEQLRSGLMNQLMASAGQIIGGGTAEGGLFSSLLKDVLGI